MRVLIAEDDDVSRLLLTRTLEKLGHEVLVARDGEEAWNLWRQSQDVDAVVSDWMMPNMDGPELCRLIRGAARPEATYPYFIFLTTLADRDHVLYGLEAGADAYLSKPLDAEELRARLRVAERITAMQKQLSRSNAQLARRDVLTGLGDRLRLAEDLASLAGRAERYGHHYCLMLCAIDHFKAYNASYGHLAGDALLGRIASRISANVRAGDVCYRYSGEEFMVILAEQDLDGGRVAAERLRQDVEALAIENEGTSVNGAAETVTISLGLAEPSEQREESPEALVRKADMALYRAKGNGRNRVEVHVGETQAE